MAAVTVDSAGALGRRPRLRSASIVLAVIVALAVPAIGVFALFKDSVAAAAGTVVSGGLKLDADTSPGSAVTWTETTSAIPAASRQSGTSLSTLANFRGVQGDTVDIRYNLTATITGDNVSARLTAALGAALPTGVTASGYRVFVKQGSLYVTTGASYPLGQTAQVPQLTASGTYPLYVVFTLFWSGTGSTGEYTSTVTATDAPTVTTVAVTLRLDQVRSGTGFS